MAEGKTDREITKIGFDDVSFFSLFLCGLFLRIESVFITIARDLLSFGFSLLCHEWKRDLSHN